MSEAVQLYRLYRPSNSGDGNEFIAKWCGSCANWGPVPYCPDMDGCTLDLDQRAKVNNVNDPGYPREWVIGRDGEPKCTAWRSK